MKFPTVVFTTCLWHTAIAKPLFEFSKERTPILKGDLLGHHVDTIFCNSTHPTTPKAPASSNTTTSPLSISLFANSSSLTYNSTTVGISSLAAANLTTYCNTTSAPFAQGRRILAFEAADCTDMAAMLTLDPGAGYWEYERTNGTGSWNGSSSGAELALRNGACALSVRFGQVGSRAETVRIGTTDLVGIILGATVGPAATTANMTATSTATGATNAIAHGTKALFYRPSAKNNGTVAKLDVTGALQCGDPGSVVNWALSSN
ncbi:hypothetical protein GGR54DRAFT_639453 [Hypoxylon sp. NC1633]|nr:hypothetical protein GGR54DRAFT_639453 [Hypoxylon sp. NC1633]